MALPDYSWRNSLGRWFASASVLRSAQEQRIELSMTIELRGCSQSTWLRSLPHYLAPRARLEGLHQRFADPLTHRDLGAPLSKRHLCSPHVVVKAQYCWKLQEWGTRNFRYWNKTPKTKIKSAHSDSWVRKRLNVDQLPAPRAEVLNSSLRRGNIEARCTKRVL